MFVKLAKYIPGRFLFYRKSLFTLRFPVIVTTHIGQKKPAVSPVLGTKLLIIRVVSQKQRVEAYFWHMPHFWLRLCQNIEKKRKRKKVQ